jgi:hypothetical protein
MQIRRFFFEFNFKFLLFLVAICLQSSALTYYVATPSSLEKKAYTNDAVVSNDSSPGTKDKPFATLARAGQAAKPGDTILIQGGFYNETLRPTTSGTQLKPIIYKNLNTSEVIISATSGLSNLTQDEIDLDQEGRQYGIYLYGLSYVIIQGISITNVTGWARIVKCNNIIFQNNNLTAATGTGTTGSIKLLFSNKNKLLNNTIHDGNDNLLIIHSDSNLISGNNIMKGRHTIWCIRAGNFNVIKNNYFHNEIQKIGEIYDSEADAPIKFDATKHNVIEGNQFAKTASSGNASPFAGIQFAGQKTIVRKNLFYETVGPAFDFTLYADEARYNYQNRVYNNVFFKTDFAGVTIGGAAGYTFYDNILKNNIFYRSVFVANDRRWAWYTQELEGKSVQVLVSRKDGYCFDNNCFYAKTANEKYLITYGFRDETNNGSQHELAWWQSNNPLLFRNNRERQPQFVDTTAHDFHFQQGSPMIDSGAYLTTTRGQGSGTVVPVVDVKYFYSGYGIPGESGDEIQLSGQTETARIVGINYDSANQSLILAKSLTWNNNQGVSLSYNGNAPDIGAFEYAGSTTHDQGHRLKISREFLVASYRKANGQFKVTFAIPKPEELNLDIYSITGKRVVHRNIGKRSAGLHTITLDVSGRNSDLLMSGMYVVEVYNTEVRLKNKLFCLR